MHEILRQTPYAQFNLDCEYNKHGDNPKERPNGSRMRTDLLIHSRGNDDNNILAVEFAGWWKRPEAVEEDRNKIREITDATYTYKYRLGVLVKINQQRAEYEYFRNSEVENP